MSGGLATYGRDEYIWWRHDKSMIWRRHDKSMMSGGLATYGGDMTGP